MERGKYIVIEGHDGTGKSTQVTAVAKHLRHRGIESIVLEEPGSEDSSQGIPVANRIREVIKDGNLEKDGITNLLLFTASRRELLNQKIHPALKLGIWVLSARNYFSGEAYQGHGEGVDIDLIEQTTRLYTDELYMNPDLAVILTLEDETERLRRINNRGATQEVPDTFEMRTQDFQARVRQGYVEIAKRYNLPTIAAEQPRELITEQIINLLPLESNTQTR